MKCFVCQAEFSGSNMLVRHLRLVHGYLFGRNLRLKCAQRDCGCVFGTFSGFRKHLNTKHLNYFDQQADTDVNLQPDVAVKEVSATGEVVSTNVEETPTTSEMLKSSNKSTLDMSGLSQSTVNSFVSSMEEVFFEIHTQAKDAALQSLPSQDTTSKKKLEQSFENFENPFTLLNSEAKRNRHFKQKWAIVEPVEMVLGTRFDSRRNKITGTFDQVIVTDRFAYVPILETLKTIFQNHHVVDMFKSRNMSREGVYADLIDAAYVKRCPLFSAEKDALQIQLFYDDFETANPLGSKKGVHKLGAIYFTLRNFPPIFNSLLVNIHLCALFHAQDSKRYGFNSILEPLVNDLKVLETEGLKLPMFKHLVHGTVIQVTGDNLGLHSLFGFVESFAARYCCRFCLLEKDCFQSVFCEDDSGVVLRTLDMHKQHCESVQRDPTLPHVCGVKHTCLLNSLKYFNTASNFSVDIMHDILEGVAQLEVKLVLQYIQENFLSAEQLAGRIHAFDYGFNQQRNRPPRVKLFDGSNDLGLNAIQCWCLLRNVPLMFGDLVQVGDSYWHLLLLLLQIVNIVFSPVLSEGMTIYLKHLIIDHHQLFKQLFPTLSLLPKHHFMIHYPRSIRNIGPILHMWCMCYEAKHNFFKKQLKSFKNITMTLAKKHQSCMAMYWESFSLERLALGPGKMVTLGELKEAKWIKHHGTEYRPDFIICTEVVSEIPVFYKIKSIVVKDDIVLLCGKLMETLCFDDHYHAFKVRMHPNMVLKVLNIKELCYFKPFDLQMKYSTSDSSLYVVPYCHFMPN
ncbi:alpha-tectorin [Sarotherodon galilaeus]